MTNPGDTSYTARRSKENRFPTWWKPTRRWKHCILQLIIKHFFILIFIPTLETVFYYEFTGDFCFCQWISVWELTFPPARNNSVPPQLHTDLEEALPSICLPARSVDEPGLSQKIHYFLWLQVKVKICILYLVTSRFLPTRFTAWWGSVWESYVPYCTLLMSCGWRSGPASSTLWSTSLASWQSVTWTKC